MRQLFCLKPGLPSVLYLLNNIISECKKYELYEPLIEHLNFKKYRFTYKESEKQYKKINSEIEKCEECRKAFFTANDSYNECIFICRSIGKKGTEKIQSFYETAI